MTEGTVVGQVARLGRYPVKSLQGEVLDRASFGPAGIPGDRGLGVVDAGTGNVLSAKSVPALLAGSATSVDGGVEVRLPDGASYAAPSPELDAAASAWLEREVRVEAPPVDDARAFSMSFNFDDQTADVFDWPCPPGTFFDLADVHVLTTASLRAAEARYPGGAWDVDRFRPTVLVEVDGAEFVDDAWVGGHLRFGTVEIAVDQPTIRCVMTTRAQGDLPRDLDIVKTINHEHGGNLGLYCTMSSPGEVAVGDDVVFLPGTG